MTHRTLTPTGVAGLFLAAWLAPALVGAQAPAAGAKPRAAPKPAAPAKGGWTAPRTPDGQPDLQGFWTNTTYVPLERPKDVTKELYTREEALETDHAGRIRRVRRNSIGSEPGG
jgi:hypothetical protein